MKEFFHVSSLQKEIRPILRRFNKPLQQQIDLCSRIHCSSFDEYINGIKAINREFDDILASTQRDVYKWMTEALFETIRKERYPYLPSRMNGVFLCSNYEEAYRFNHYYRAGKAKIYRCFLPEELVSSFDMNLFTHVDEAIRDFFRHKQIEEHGTLLDMKKIFDDQCNTVNLYWRNCGFSGDGKEMLCECEQIQLELV